MTRLSRLLLALLLGGALAGLRWGSPGRFEEEVRRSR